MGSTSRVARETEMKEGMCVVEIDRQTDRQTNRQTDRHRERDSGARGLCDAYLLALDIWSIFISTGFNV